MPDPARGPKKPDGSFPPVVRQMIYDRDEYRCQRCGDPADTGPYGASVQHRLARGMGGTSDPAIAKAPNGLLVCGSGTTGCHGYIEAHPVEAARMGWSVEPWALPASVPVFTYRGWVAFTESAAVPTTEPPNGDAHELAVRRSPGEQL